jgi:hypothetical protein
MSDDEAMSSSQIDDTVLMHHLNRIFAPILRDDNHNPIPPYDAIVPLTEGDFSSDQTYGPALLTQLAALHDTITPGFDEGGRLNREQWLRTVAQLFASALKGFSRSCPDTIDFDQLADLGPDEKVALANLTQVVGSFNYYFTNPTEDFPSAWQQCRRCLKVNHITITEEHWRSLLMDCNQMVDAARSTVLNSKTREFEKSIMAWVDSQRANAENQVIETVLESNHPPFTEDPRIVEWIARQADTLKDEARKKAIAQATRKARSLYDDTLRKAQEGHDADLQLILEDKERRLAEARALAEQEISTFKMDLKAEKAQRIDTLKHDNLLANRTTRKPRPDPISATRRKRASRTPSIADTNTSRPNSPAPIEVDHAPGNEEQEGNSPTPKADTPLRPPEKVETNDLMANMLQVMNQCMQTHLAPITARLTTLEDAKAATTWNFNPREETYAQYGIGDVDIDGGYVDHATSEQRELLAQQNETAQYYMQLNKEESRRLDEEEESQRKWANASAEERAHLVEEAGGNAADVGAATNPIYIPSQESTNNTIHDGRRPIDGLTWQQVLPRGNRQTTPSNWSSSQSNLLKALPADAPARPNPTKASKALPTIGGDTYANRTGRNTERRNRPTAQTANPATSSPTPSALSAGILNSRGTTKNDIIQSAKAVFGANLSGRLNKGQLVLAYSNLLAARGAGETTQQTNTTAAQRSNRPNYQNRATVEWNVRRRLGCGAIDFHKPYNGDAYQLIQAIQTRIRQQLGEASPEIIVLAGRWWSPLSSNFTLTFAGRPTVATVLKYKEAILRPFGPNIFELTPEEGQTRLVFQGVPLMRNADGELPPPEEVCRELGKNLPYRACTPIGGPEWCKATRENPSARIGAFTFLLSDPGRKLANIIRKPVFMYGARVNVGYATRFTPFRQCAKCHVLYHSTEKCNRPPGYTRCHICGIPNHTADDHAQKCKANTHRSLLCDCPIRCFNCVANGKSGEGHLAIDEFCPLKKNKRRMMNQNDPTNTHPIPQTRSVSFAEPPPTNVTIAAPPPTNVTITNAPPRVDDL